MCYFQLWVREVIKERKSGAAPLLTLRGWAKAEAVSKTGQFKYSAASSSLIYVTMVLSDVVLICFDVLHT